MAENPENDAEQMLHRDKPTPIVLFISTKKVALAQFGHYLVSLRFPLFSITMVEKLYFYKWWDLSRESLLSKVNALPCEPLPGPLIKFHLVLFGSILIRTFM